MTAALFVAPKQPTDVVVEGFRPGVAQRLGVEYETLSAANPRLVYCSISGYGQTGPMRGVAGHDINYISYAGVLGASGREGTDRLRFLPSRSGTSSGER